MIDVIIQAGHAGGVRNAGEGRAPSLGTAGESARTVPVADQAAELLRAVGLDVLREDAFHDERRNCRLAVALHFDGAATACASGASIGYPAGVPAGSNKPAADLWRQVYGAVWPFRWMPDNFTAALRGYYGYRWTVTELAEIVIEFGELTCPDQRAWLDARVDSGELARLVAVWALAVLDPTGELVAEAPVPATVEPWASDAWRKARAAGVITDGSDPDSTVTVERLVTFLDRAGALPDPEPGRLRRLFRR